MSSAALSCSLLIDINVIFYVCAMSFLCFYISSSNFLRNGEVEIKEGRGLREKQQKKEMTDVEEREMSGAAGSTS